MKLIPAKPSTTLVNFYYWMNAYGFVYLDRWDRERNDELDRIFLVDYPHFDNSPREIALLRVKDGTELIYENNYVYFSPAKLTRSNLVNKGLKVYDNGLVFMRF